MRLLFFEHLLDGGHKWWCGVVLAALTMVGLNGVVSRSFDEGHGLWCAPGRRAPSGVMVASSAGLAKFMRILIMNIAWRFNGGDDI
jgi:hypothetical protein